MNRTSFILFSAVVCFSCGLPTAPERSSTSSNDELVEDSRCKPDSCGPIHALALVCPDGTPAKDPRCLLDQSRGQCAWELPKCSAPTGTGTGSVNNGGSGNSAEVCTTDTTGTVQCDEARVDGGTSQPGSESGNVILDCKPEECGDAPDATCPGGANGSWECVRHPLSGVCAYLTLQCAPVDADK